MISARLLVLSLSMSLCGVAMTACTNETRIIASKKPVDTAPADEAPPESEEPAATPVVTPAEEPFELFGAALGQRTEVPFETLLATPAAYAGKAIITEGVVRQSCTKRGCWMDIRPEDDRASEASLTVRFKGYKFFVPLNSRGARVRMEGITRVTTMSAEQVAEMESEGAVITGKKADGSADSVEFTASGVEMRGRSRE